MRPRGAASANDFRARAHLSMGVRGHCNEGRAPSPGRRRCGAPGDRLRLPRTLGSGAAGTRGAPSPGRHLTGRHPGQSPGGRAPRRRSGRPAPATRPRSDWSRWWRWYWPRPPPSCRSPSSSPTPAARPSRPGPPSTPPSNPKGSRPRPPSAVRPGDAPWPPGPPVPPGGTGYGRDRAMVTVAVAPEVRSPARCLASAGASLPRRCERHREAPDRRTLFATVG